MIISAPAIETFSLARTAGSLPVCDWRTDMRSAQLHFHDLKPTLGSFREDVLDGLRGFPKQIAPKYFYDEAGSKLFDAITELPEYYPTRTEIEILERNRERIARLVDEGCVLIELGSGSSRKVRVLLDALSPSAYLPIDISREHLRESASRLAADHPGLEVHATCADFTRPIQLPESASRTSRVAFFPGSSIGNFDLPDALALLRTINELVGPHGSLLIGVDRKKSPLLLHQAYNDGQEITAAFNRNLLERINRELGGTFDCEQFAHYAFYNPVRGRIEMHLVSLLDQEVVVAGESFNFREGETIHTENSYKYTRAEFISLANKAGFELIESWSDALSLFSVFYLRVVRSARRV